MWHIPCEVEKVLNIGQVHLSSLLDCLSLPKIVLVCIKMAFYIEFQFYLNRYICIYNFYVFNLIGKSFKATKYRLIQDFIGLCGLIQLLDDFQMPWNVCYS